MNKPALQIISEALEDERRRELLTLENDLLNYLLHPQSEADVSALSPEHEKGFRLGFQQAFEKASEKVQELFEQLLESGH